MTRTIRTAGCGRRCFRRRSGSTRSVSRSSAQGRLCGGRPRGAAFILPRALRAEQHGGHRRRRRGNGADSRVGRAPFRSGSQVQARPVLVPAEPFSWAPGESGDSRSSRSRGPRSRGRSPGLPIRLRRRSTFWRWCSEAGQLGPLAGDREKMKLVHTIDASSWNPVPAGSSASCSHATRESGKRPRRRSWASSSPLRRRTHSRPARQGRPSGSRSSARSMPARR